MALKIMILGANGFIGSALTSAILEKRPWEVFGIDLSDNPRTNERDSIPPLCA
jgi:nucleoside-diphosphate-sugar epimerase